jgi:predicted RNA-binding Zn-ribbon protein involved in translation (DUF1610 family)
VNKTDKKDRTEPKKEVWIYLEWEAFWATGRRLFGDKLNDWKFQCPRCGNVHVIGKRPGSPLKQRVRTATWLCEKCHLQFLPIHLARGDDSEIKERLSTLAIAGLKEPHTARLLQKTPHGESDRPLIDFYRGGKKEEASHG